MPDEAESAWKSWRQLMRGWQYLTWRDEDVASLRLPAEFFGAETWAERSDIARLQLLYEHGGVYADCDVTLVRSIEPLLGAVDDLVLFEEERADGLDVPVLVCNGLVAAAPGNSTLRLALSRLRRNVRANPGAAPNIRTGPVYLSSILDYALSCDHRVRVYPPGFLSVTGSAAPHSYAVTRIQPPSDCYWAAVPSSQRTTVRRTGRSLVTEWSTEVQLIPARIRRRIRKARTAKRSTARYG
jgi:hypothetical protein